MKDKILFSNIFVCEIMIIETVRKYFLNHAKINRMKLGIKVMISPN